MSEHEDEEPKRMFEHGSEPTPEQIKLANRLAYPEDGNSPLLTNEREALRALLREREEHRLGVLAGAQLQAATQLKRKNAEARVAELEAQLAHEQEQHRLGVLNAEAQLSAVRADACVRQEALRAAVIRADAAEAQLQASRGVGKAAEADCARLRADLAAAASRLAHEKQESQANRDRGDAAIRHLQAAEEKLARATGCRECAEREGKLAESKQFLADVEKGKRILLARVTPPAAPDNPADDPAMSLERMGAPAAPEPERCPCGDWGRPGHPSGDCGQCEPPAAKPERYACARCGVLRTKAEGGTTFTVCDDCWDRHGQPLPILETREPAPEPPAAEPPIHRWPPDGCAIMPCCGKTPFDALADRLTSDPALVTCRAEPPEEQDGEA